MAKKCLDLSWFFLYYTNNRSTVKDPAALVYVITVYIDTHIDTHTRIDKERFLYMFRKSNSHTRTGRGIPLFFTLWFAVCAIVSASVFAITIFLLYTVFTDPSIIGEFAAKIEQGYSNTLNKSMPRP